LQACSSSHSELPDSKLKKQGYDSPWLKKQQQIFASKNPVTISTIGNLQLTTRMAAAAEIPEDISKINLFFTAEGSASLALGMVAPPMYASALVVGGLLLIPLSSYLYIHEKNKWETISGVLVKTEITGRLHRAIVKKLTMDSVDKRAVQGEIDIAVHAFGLVRSTSNNTHCLMLSADFILSGTSSNDCRESLKITEINRSLDAPPPQCSRLELFSKNRGALLKMMADEYIDVLAVMAVERILKKCPL